MPCYLYTSWISKQKYISVKYAYWLQYIQKEEKCVQRSPVTCLVNMWENIVISVTTIRYI